MTSRTDTLFRALLGRADAQQRCQNVAQLLYLAAEAITAAAWKSPRYSYANNWISDLGSATSGVFQGRELNSPLHVVMNSGFIVQGLLFGIATVLLSRTISGRSRFTAVMGVVTMIGYILVGTFHGSLQAQQNGTLPLHFTGATLAILGGNVLALVLGIHWRKTPETRLIGLLSISSEHSAWSSYSLSS